MSRWTGLRRRVGEEATAATKGWSSANSTTLEVATHACNAMQATRKDDDEFRPDLAGTDGMDGSWRTAGLAFR